MLRKGISRTNPVLGMGMSRPSILLYREGSGSLGIYIRSQVQVLPSNPQSAVWSHNGPNALIPSNDYRNGLFQLCHLFLMRRKLIGCKGALLWLSRPLKVDALILTPVNLPRWWRLFFEAKHDLSVQENLDQLNVEVPGPTMSKHIMYQAASPQLYYV